MGTIGPEAVQKCCNDLAKCLEDPDLAWNSDVSWMDSTWQYIQFWIHLFLFTRPSNHFVWNHASCHISGLVFSASSRHGVSISSLMHQTKIRMFERKHPAPFNLWISRRHPGGVCDGVWLHHWICDFWTAASFYTPYSIVFSLLYLKDCNSPSWMTVDISWLILSLFEVELDYLIHEHFTFCVGFPWKQALSSVEPALRCWGAAKAAEVPEKGLEHIEVSGVVVVVVVTSKKCMRNEWLKRINATSGCISGLGCVGWSWWAWR